MWIAERDTTRQRATDEDRAMAHVSYGSAENREDARALLLTGIKAEIQHYLDGPVAYFNASCVIRLTMIMGELLDNSEVNAAECDGLRFRVR